MRQSLEKRKMSHRFADHNIVKSNNPSHQNTPYKLQSQSPDTNLSYYSSIEKYLSVKKELLHQVTSIKSRSKVALLQFKQINK